MLTFLQYVFLLRKKQLCHIFPNVNSSSHISKNGGFTKIQMHTWLNNHLGDLQLFSCYSSAN